jgi:hypothetical protein
MFHFQWSETTYNSSEYRYNRLFVLLTLSDYSFIEYVTYKLNLRFVDFFYKMNTIYI